ncbi:S66 family peptidase [Butyrivibrio sp. INlla21]|uniref:S66 family peptidase n=1 Tax=Butyrivibrio sp. INlla21 TaxID=1520811 RepID=UPI0008F3CFB1|nr:S66 peptidase family protein [Butyrivibrio sp. INlla21]SFU70461.1 Muramoyltetrapeptide carboxypeptidase LdcA (peptidoglycan recycling) [Butyrivibrio sp. INlla21]
MVKTVGIVSLSRGTIGEDFVKHEVELGTKRLEEMGLKVKFMPNALKGIDYLEAHPEKRAEDLIAAYKDPEVDMILCAIGGDDTYRLLPYLFDNDELKKAVNDKLFLGFSDTTINHFMLHKVGVESFYGQSFLADICEMDKDILPYTKKYFTELITTGKIKEITPSDVWYESRTNFDLDQMGTALPMHEDNGFELLQGESSFDGEILGGCIDSIYDIFNGERYADMPVLCSKYELFPSKEDWKGKILLLESSEEQPSPEKYRAALQYLKDYGVFDVISGVLVGKPMDRKYEAEYKQVLKEVIANESLPIVCNINIGHALPRCIIPFGVEAVVDTSDRKMVKFTWQ